MYCSVYWGTFTAKDTSGFPRKYGIYKEMSIQYIGHILALFDYSYSSVKYPIKCLDNYELRYRKACENKALGFKAWLLTV